MDSWLTDGSFESIKKALASGISPNAYDENGVRMLEFAIRRRDSQAIGYLLANGADPYLSCPLGQSSNGLHEAIKAGNLNNVALILNYDSTLLNTRCSEGRTPLHTATTEGYFDIVQFLVERGANQSAADHYGNLPVHLAAQVQPINSFLFLASKGNVHIVNDCNKTALEVFFDSQSPEIFEGYICSVDLSMQEHIRWALMILAIRKNQTPFLVEKGLSYQNLWLLMINDSHGFNDFLTLACKLDKVYAIQKFIDFLHTQKNSCSIYSVQIENKNALHWAIVNKNVETVEFLLNFPRLVTDKHNKTRTSGNVALQHAIKLHSVPMVALLLNAGAEIGTLLNNCIDKKTCLKIIRLLVQHGAPLQKSTGIHRLTPFHRAVVKKHINAMEVILESLPIETARNGVINSVAKHGFTPLHDAVWSRNVKAVEMVVEAGANLDAQLDEYVFRGFGGSTSLHLAVRSKHITFVAYLIKKGASVDIPDAADRTPLDWAISMENRDLINILISAGSEVSDLEQDPFFYFDLLFSTEEGEALRDRLINVGYTFEFPSDAESGDTELEKERRELVRKIKPRSLQDQCASAIRRHLKPYVWQRVVVLPLPKPVQDYIITDVDIGEICKRHNRYSHNICPRLHLHSIRIYGSDDPIFDS